MSVEPPTQIVLRAELAELDRLHTWLEGHCESHRLSYRLSFQLDLCVTELVTNVISYGYPGQPAPEEVIAVHFAATPTHVVLEIIDQGVAFDPLAQPAPELARSLDEAKIGGLGLPLVRKNVEEIAYRREHGSNRLRLSFPMSHEA
jgi:anti-sigma regulatory factor (Ser/Thr protein kinase)